MTGGFRMERMSLHTNIRINDKKSKKVIYNLIQQSTEYDIECYVDDETYSLTSYCYIKGFTKDKNEGENFIKLLAQKEVFPVHIHDLIEEQLNT